MPVPGYTIDTSDEYVGTDVGDSDWTTATFGGSARTLETRITRPPRTLPQRPDQHRSNNPVPAALAANRENEVRVPRAVPRRRPANPAQLRISQLPRLAVDRDGFASAVDGKQQAAFVFAWPGQHPRAPDRDGVLAAVPASLSSQQASTSPH